MEERKGKEEERGRKQWKTSVCYSLINKKEKIFNRFITRSARNRNEIDLL